MPPRRLDFALLTGYFVQRDGPRPRPRPRHRRSVRGLSHGAALALHRHCRITTTPAMCENWKPCSDAQ